jgi:hypothetical protein
MEITEAVTDSSMEVGLEVDAEKIKCMRMFGHRDG